MLPDLLAETDAGMRFVWISHPENYFEKVNFTSGLTEIVQPFKFPASNAFVDLNADYAAGN